MQPESDSNSASDSDASTHEQSSAILWEPRQRISDKKTGQDPPSPDSYLALQIARYTRDSETYDVHDLVFQSGSLCGRGTRVWKVSLSTAPGVMLALKLSWLDHNCALRIQDVYTRIKTGNVRKFLLPNRM